MKISGLQNQGLQQAYNKQIERAKSAGSSVDRGEAARKSPSDSIEISANAQLMQRILEEVRRSEGTPAEQLELLRQQVRDDSYEVSFQNLAEQLLPSLL